MLLLGQTGALINYEFAVTLGLQEPALQVTAVGVVMNQGFAVADTLVYLPLLMVGVIGLWLHKAWGLFAMIAAFAITVYWPLACLFMLFYSKNIPGFAFDKYLSYTILLLSISFLGLLSLRYLYKKRHILSDA